MRRWIVIAGLSVLLAAAIAAAGEAAARLMKVHVQGIDGRLFVHSYDDIAYFNARRAEGLRAFGQPVYTDEHGFRIAPGSKTAAGRRGILFIGDSVTFGLGVPEEETFVGRLRQVWPDRTLYNAAVIGFNAVFDLQAAHHFIPALRPLDAVVVMVALNDIEEISASDIRRYIQVPDPDAANGVLARANVYLRQQSALFVLLKNVLRDVPRQYFLEDTEFPYHQPKMVASVASSVAEIEAIARANGTKTYVVMLPYAYQLRTQDPAMRYPQDILSKALADRGIMAIDLYPCLAKAPDSASLFLYRDHMHFSSDGHARAAECLRQLLPSV